MFLICKDKFDKFLYLDQSDYPWGLEIKSESLCSLLPFGSLLFLLCYSYFLRLRDENYKSI